MSDDAPDLSSVIAGITEDGVYVEPSMQQQVPRRQETSLEDVVGSATPPVYVVVWPLSTNDAFGGDGESLARTLVDDGAPAGTYVVAGPRYDDVPETSTVSLGVDRDVLYADLLGNEVSGTGLGPMLQVVVPAVVDGTSERQFEELDEDGTTTGSDGTEVRSQPADDGGDDGSGIGPVVGIGAVVALVVAAVLVGRRLSRRRRGGRRQALPAAVLRRVRAAADGRLARRAESEVLALGEALDAHDIDPGDDAAAWQAALDHYDLARRTLERAEGTADVVGAVVLAGRGTDALSHADRGEPWTPTRPCYLNPLHGPATTRTTWHGARFPACRACDHDVREEREPDVLAVTVGDRSVHYAEADVEPWASTGYGALDEDLVAALQGRR